MIGVLLITHGRLGAHFVDTLAGMLGQLSLPTEVLEIHRHDEPDTHITRALAAIDRLDSGAGVLLITDAFGSTPSNIANRAAHAGQSAGRCRVIAGINLPMLVRIYNYPALDLDATVASAIEAGRGGIVACDSPHSPTDAQE